MPGHVYAVSTRSHGSEGGRARERAWELVDLWSITCCPIKGKKHLQERSALAQLVTWSLRRIGTQVFAVRILNIFIFSFVFLVFSLVFFFLELGSGLGLVLGFRLVFL